MREISKLHGASRTSRYRSLGSVLALGLVTALGGCDCGDGQTIRAIEAALEIYDGRVSGDVPVELIDVGTVPLGGRATVPLVAANPGERDIFVCVDAALGACSESTHLDPAEGPYSLLFEGTDNGTWAVTPGGRREIRLAFTPTAEGTFEATVVIFHDGTNGPETRILIRGSGVAPQVEISPTDLDFGAVTVGLRTTLPLRLTNQTQFPQAVEIPALDQTTVTFGVIDQDGNQVPTDQSFTGTVPGNGSIDITVFFQPDQELSYSDTLTVYFCATCATTVNMTGVGIKPAFEVTPTVLDFGDVEEGASATQTFSVRNLSSMYPITISDAAVAGTTNEFVINPREALPRQLLPMETLVVEVTYTGDGPGEDADLVEVSTNAWDDPMTGSDESKGQVALTGRTMGPNIDAFPDRLTFGTVAINSTPAQRTVVVTNVGTAALSINGVSFMGSSPEMTLTQSPASFPVNLAPGASTDLIVTYAPVDAGVDTAQITITSDDRDEPSLVVDVHGVGGVPTTCSVSVAPPQVAFGLVERGRQVTLPVELRNSGAQPCSLSGFALTGDAEIAMPNPPSGTLNVAAGQSFRLDLTYAPMAYGSHSARLELMSDDPAQPTIQVPVTGQSEQSEVLVIPSQVDFNVVPVLCRSPIRDITVYNTGASRVTVNRVYLDPTTSTEFELTPVATPLTINAGASTTIQIRYRPAQIGADTGVLYIDHSAASAPVAVPLTGEGQVSPTVTDTFNQLPAPQADVLFVVDNSCSMSQEQSSLGGNLTAFLQYARNANIDFHIGVITTDATRNTDGGRFRGTPRIIDPTTANGDAVFRNTVSLGTGGSGTERGLETAYLALSDPLINTHNAGFLRAAAALAVIFVSDENDFSNRAVTFYENFFRNIKGFGNTSMFSASAVVGTSQSSCNGPGGRATYAPRYISVAQNTGGVVESICAANWGQTLANIGLNSFGLRRQFGLSSAPVASTISVRIDGAQVPQSSGSTDNWTFDATTNTITFATSQTPPEGATITVTYSVACLN